MHRSAQSRQKGGALERTVQLPQLPPAHHGRRWRHGGSLARMMEVGLGDGEFRPRERADPDPIAPFLFRLQQHFFSACKLRLEANYKRFSVQEPRSAERFCQAQSLMYEH